MESEAFKGFQPPTVDLSGISRLLAFDAAAVSVAVVET